MKQSRPYLLHIIEAIDTIQQYIGKTSFLSFKEDQKTQDAVVCQLEIIGEASSKLEENFIKTYTGIPWRDIKDFRNKLIHDYWQLDFDLIWNVATKETVSLQKQLLKILSKIKE